MPKRKRTEASEPQSKAKQTQAKLPWASNAAGTTEDPKIDFKVPSKDKEITCERRGGPDSKPDLIFTHGAGGGLSNAATAEFAEGFAGISPIVSFQGTMNLQSRTRSFQTVLLHEGVKCALGGRSMGARAAVLTAQQPDSGISTLVLVSYPMIGAQKGDSREQILLDLPEGIDVLFISGSKDSMCKMENLHRVAEKMKARSWIVQVEGADHGMSMSSKPGTRPMRMKTGTLAAQWLADRDASNSYRTLSWNGNDREVIDSGWLSSSDQDAASGSSTQQGKKRRK